MNRKRKYRPKVGDLVKVIVDGTSSVGIVLEREGHYVTVDGVRWRERFDIDGVKYLEPEQMKAMSENRC